MKTSIKTAAILLIGVATATMADVSGTVITAADGSQSIKYTIDMQPGWNMFSIPGYKAYKVQDILGDNESVNTIFSYSPPTNQWMSFSANDTSGDLTELVPGVGYWINAKENIQLNFESNIMQTGSYEIGSITMNPNSANQKNINVTTDDYSNMWSESGTMKPQFKQGYGSVDWSVARSNNGSMFWNTSTNENDWMFIDSNGTSQTGWSNYRNMSNNIGSNFMTSGGMGR